MKNKSAELFYERLSWIRNIHWNSHALYIDENWGSRKDDYEILKSVIISCEPNRILDVGCGTGRLFPLFDSLNIKEVLGQDISEKALKIADTRYSYNNIKTVCVDLLDLDFPPQFFDLAISNRVLQHIPANKISQYVKKLAQLCKYIYINEMCKSDLTAESYYMFHHKYEELFENNGFSIMNKGMIENQTWYLFLNKK